MAQGKEGNIRVGAKSPSTGLGRGISLTLEIVGSVIYLSG